MRLAKNDVLIKKLLSKKILKVDKYGNVKGQRLDVYGYYIIMYKGRNLKCHRIAYEHFYGGLKPSLHINHIDGIKSNNSKKNLEQITKSENIKHMHAVISRATLTRKDAGYIRRSYSSGKWTQGGLAAKYKCSTRAIQHIIARTRHG